MCVLLQKCSMFSDSVQMDVESQGGGDVGGSDSQVFCHLNSVHALAFMARHGRHTHQHPHHTTPHNATNTTNTTQGSDRLLLLCW